MIQNSSVSVAARLWVGWLRNQNPIPCRNKQFLYFPHLAIQTLGSAHTPVEFAPRVLSPGIKGKLIAHLQG